jgi:DNA (cytosine-5)-methyltransferase 1
MFPHLRVVRERWFEANFGLDGDGLPSRPAGSLLRRGYLTVTGSGTPGWIYYTLGRTQNLDDCRKAMGVNWMNRKELSQAIPPPYAAYVGRQALLASLARRGKEPAR